MLCSSYSNVISQSVKSKDLPLRVTTAVCIVSTLFFSAGCVRDAGRAIYQPVKSIPINTKVYVQTDLLNFRACPSVKCQIIKVLRRDDKATTIDSKNGWVKINDQSGKTGWVSTKYIAARKVDSNDLKTEQRSNVLQKGQKKEKQTIDLDALVEVTSDTTVEKKVSNSFKPQKQVVNLGELMEESDN